MAFSTPSGATSMAVDAVILAGGRGRRLGGVQKAQVVVAGRSLLDRVLGAADGARHIVLVGPAELGRVGITTVLEDPPGGGPVAGLGAGVAALDAVHLDDAPVLVLACDVPLAHRAVPRLLVALAAQPGCDGVQLVDVGGRAQSLVAVYRRVALRAALAHLPDGGHGCSMRRLVAGLVLAPVADVDDDGADADTWADVARLDARIARGDGPAHVPGPTP